jgi:hypothetical protein
MADDWYRIQEIQAAQRRADEEAQRLALQREQQEAVIREAGRAEAARQEAQRQYDYQRSLDRIQPISGDRSSYVDDSRAIDEERKRLENEDRRRQAEEEERSRIELFEAMKRDVLVGQEQERNRRLAEGGQLNQEETCNAQLIRDYIRLVTHSLDVSISSSNAKAPCTLQVCSHVPVGESAVHQRYAKLWHEEWSWPQLPNIDEFTRVVKLLLENRKYFTKCECCGIRKPVAFVERSICMACLENYLGVQF